MTICQCDDSTMKNNHGGTENTEETNSKKAVGKQSFSETNITNWHFNPKFLNT